MKEAEDTEKRLERRMNFVISSCSVCCGVMPVVYFERAGILFKSTGIWSDIGLAFAAALLSGVFYYFFASLRKFLKKIFSKKGG